MRHEQKQKQNEEKTYDIIGTLVEEFGLKEPSYPEVHWIGRKKKFEDLGIDAAYKKYFERTRKGKDALYLYEEKVILAGTDKDKKISEEVMHFLHFENSGVASSFLERQVENPSDFWNLQILVEALGYFGSKLITKRDHTYKEFSGYKDFMKKVSGKEIDYSELWKIVEADPELRNRIYVYKNAFDLGEGLYDHYLSKNISKKQIKNLMKHPFKEDFSATKKYMYLREKCVKNNPHFFKDIQRL